MPQNAPFRSPEAECLKIRPLQTEWEFTKRAGGRVAWIGRPLGVRSEWSFS